MKLLQGGAPKCGNFWLYRILQGVIIFLVVVLLLLGSYTQKKSDENESLKNTLGVLESSVEQQKTKNQLQFDSLHQLILLQDKMHLRLKDSLNLLKTKRLQIKNSSNENKAAINRIHDVDSIYRVVARHYK